MIKTKFGTSFVIALLLGTTLSNAAAAPGQVKPFTLSIDAYRDKAGNADVKLQVNVEYEGFTAPTLAQHIQLKSFDSAKQLRWTKNSQDVSLSPANNASLVVQTYTDTVRGQPINALVQVQNPETTNKENLYATTSVKSKPDLAVASVVVPPKVMVGQPFNYTAWIQELQGDLFSMSDVTLKEGDVVLDITRELELHPNGMTNAVMTTTFNTVGRRTLTVNVENVWYGDYDYSNNVKEIVVDVVEYDGSLAFRGQYMGRVGYVIDTQVISQYSHTKSNSVGSSEYGSSTLIGVPLTSGVIPKLEISLGGDGALRPDKQYILTDVPVNNTWQQIDTRVDLIVSQQGSDKCTVYVNYTALDAVHYSETHQRTWGSVRVVRSEFNDALIYPQTSYDCRIVATTSAGDYGGTIVVPVTHTPINDGWDYWQFGNHYIGSRSFIEVLGAAEGRVNP